MQRINLRFLLFMLPLLVALLSINGCGQKPNRIALATTTSTVDSGLMAEILPEFEETFGIEIDVIAVGTGEALRLGRAGDADVVLVHARSLEDAFVAEGYGINRQDVMCNDFVILGSAEDSANIQGGHSAAQALTQIAATQAPFASRGDESGTHIREKALWATADVQPAGDWYIEAGQGMGSTLTLANEQDAYILSDRGTFIQRQASGLSLVLMVEDDPLLINPYGIIAVNPALHDDVNAEATAQFIDWIVSAETQQKISDYRIEGQQLFFTEPAYCFGN